MRPPTLVALTDRARRDFADCLRFISDHPRGNAADREREIYWGLSVIASGPEHRRVEVNRSGGIGLRRRSAAQFVIIYAYFPPKNQRPHGIVSIRAIRHRRVRDVFSGVRDSQPHTGTYHT